MHRLGLGTRTKLYDWRAIAADPGRQAAPIFFLNLGHHHIVCIHCRGSLVIDSRTDEVLRRQGRMQTMRGKQGAVPL